MPDRIGSATAKIERADKHVEELEVELLRFHDSNPYKFSAQHDPETRELVYYMVDVGDTPTAVPLIAADILQNLRSALDHLVWGFSDAKIRGSFTAFPIFDPSRVNDTYFARKIVGLPPEGKKIIEGLKPYKGGNAALWRLHELNRIDKHQLIVTVASSLGPLNIGKHAAHVKHGSSSVLVRNGQTFVLKVAQDVFIGPRRQPCPLKAGDVLLVDPPDSKIDEDIDFRFHVAFNEPGIAQGEPIVEALNQIRDHVGEIIARFAGLK